MLSVNPLHLQMLVMENPHSFPVNFEWALSNRVPTFSVTPAAGVRQSRINKHLYREVDARAGSKGQGKSRRIWTPSGTSALHIKGTSTATQQQVKAVAPGRASSAMSAASAGNNRGRLCYARS